MIEERAKKNDKGEIKAWTEEQLNEMFTFLISEVEKLHKANLFYRDIKPANLGFDSNLKLAFSNFSNAIIKFND